MSELTRAHASLMTAMMADEIAELEDKLDSVLTLHMPEVVGWTADLECICGWMETCDGLTWREHLEQAIGL